MNLKPLGMILLLALALVAGPTIGCGPEPASGGTPPTGAGEVANASSTAPVPPSDRINVVTTTNIVADWAKQVGEDRVKVFSLVSAGSDPHAFQPGAQDIRRIADADLVLSIGLSLEAGWMNELLENAARQPSGIVAVGDAIEPLATADYGVQEDEDHGEGEDADSHGRFDPHFWLTRSAYSGRSTTSRRGCRCWTRKPTAITATTRRPIARSWTVCTNGSKSRWPWSPPSAGCW